MLNRTRIKRKAAVALAKLGRFTTDEALPFAQRSVSLATGAADDAMLRLLGSDFEERVRRVNVNAPFGRTDPFGFDLQTAKYAAAVAAFFHRVYFRSEVFGVGRLPHGRVLLIANHSGQIPIDAMLIGASLFYDADPPRFVRSMVEKWTQTLPFVGTFFQRCGQVVGVPENARRLLAQGDAVLVFPEGARGVSKPFAQRYQLCDFGLGFMRLALETNTPVVPVAVVGAEEQYINVGNSTRLAKLFQMPVFPLIPQALLPGGALPLPTRYRLHFGEPLHFDGDPDDEDAVIEEKVMLVRDTIQGMLDRGLEERPAIFW
jgi:1-acyl-sn-glycerol-3-phosphate acyltransferase